MTISSLDILRTSFRSQQKHIDGLQKELDELDILRSELVARIEQCFETQKSIQEALSILVK